MHAFKGLLTLIVFFLQHNLFCSYYFSSGHQLMASSSMSKMRVEPPGEVDQQHEAVAERQHSRLVEVRSVKQPKQPRDLSE